MKTQNKLPSENRNSLCERAVQRRWLLTLSVPLLSALALSGCARGLNGAGAFPKSPKKDGLRGGGAAALGLIALLVNLMAPAMVNAQDAVPAANPATAISLPDKATIPNAAPAALPSAPVTPLSAPMLAVGRVIPAGARVVVMLMDEARSGKAKVGDVLRFQVRDDVRAANGRLLIPAGTHAAGKVIESRRADAFGRPGRVGVACDRLLPEHDGNPIPVPVAATVGYGMQHDARDLTVPAVLTAGAAGATVTFYTAFATNDGTRGLLAGVGTVAVIGALWRGSEATLRPGATFAVVVTEETIIGASPVALSPIKP